MQMGMKLLPLEAAGIAGTSAAAAGSVAVAASPGPLLDQGLPLEQGPLLEQGHLEAAETVTTSAQMVEVARSPMLDLLEQEGPRSSLKENMACLHPSSTFTTTIIF